jgi:transposase
MVSNPQDEKKKKENKDSDKNIVDILIDSDEFDFYLDHQLNVADYKQNWSAYNKTQTNEFRMVQEILIELLDSLIISKKLKRPGRPFLDLKEMIYCCVMRAYIGKSSRRSASFLDYAVLKGYISKIPHHNTILNYYKEEAMTDILKFLVEKSASPLKDFELDFTTDSSGFSTSLFGRWLTVRNETKKDKRIYKKAHITSGVKSNIITAIEITPGYYADSPQFDKLVKITAKTFEIREVSADKAYSSRKNLQTVAELGGIPYIAFKENAKVSPRGNLVWNRMKIFYDKYREYFMMHYHKRSNAETVFSMIKRKLGDYLYSRSNVGQANEILCKASAHNICVLIQEYHENSIKLNFNYCAKMEVRR